jgi:hypothetical protein
MPCRLGETFEHVAVGRELVGRGDDEAPASLCGQRGIRELVQVDRRRIAHDDLTGSGADELRADHVADALRASSIQ